MIITRDENTWVFVFTRTGLYSCSFIPDRICAVLRPGFNRQYLYELKSVFSLYRQENVRRQEICHQSDGKGAY